MPVNARPAVCSMKISRDVRDYPARRKMEDASRLPARAGGAGHCASSLLQLDGRQTGQGMMARAGCRATHLRKPRMGLLRQAFVVQQRDVPNACRRHGDAGKTELHIKISRLKARILKLNCVDSSARESLMLPLRVQRQPP